MSPARIDSAMTTRGEPQPVNDWQTAWYRSQRLVNDMDRSLGRAYLAIPLAFITGVVVGWWFL